MLVKHDDLGKYVKLANGKVGEIIKVDYSSNYPVEVLVGNKSYFYKENGSYLGYYRGHILGLVKFIDKSEFENISLVGEKSELDTKIRKLILSDDYIVYKEKLLELLEERANLE